MSPSGDADRLNEASGAARFVLGGRYGSEPEELSFARLDRFAERGGRLVETSYSYARGTAKKVVGDWIGANPGLVGAVTKIGHDTTGQDIPLTRSTVEQHARECVDALQVDVLDVALYHSDDPTRSVPELAETLAALVDGGLARRVGVANWSADRLAPLADLLATSGITPVVSYHLSLAEPRPDALNPGNLAADRGILEVVDLHRLPLLSWSAGAQGFFARTAPRAPDAGTDAFDTPVNRSRRERCRTLAAELGNRPEAIALAWTLHRTGVWPSIGPNTVEQLDGSLEAAALTLSDDQALWLRDGQPQKAA